MNYCMSDGAYVEFFVVKDGVRTNVKISRMEHVAKVLTEKITDGVLELLGDEVN